jgi:hypothetical protein
VPAFETTPSATGAAIVTRASRVRVQIICSRPHLVDPDTGENIPAFAAIPGQIDWGSSKLHWPGRNRVRMARNTRQDRSVLYLRVLLVIRQEVEYEEKLEKRQPLIFGLIANRAMSRKKTSNPAFERPLSTVSRRSNRRRPNNELPPVVTVMVLNRRRKPGQDSALISPLPM